MTDMPTRDFSHRFEQTTYMLVILFSDSPPRWMEEILHRFGFYNTAIVSVRVVAPSTSSASKPETRHCLGWQSELQAAVGGLGFGV